MCIDLDTFNISSPLPLIFDTVSVSNINCIGSSSGAISFSVSGGKKYVVDAESYHYLINFNMSDTIAFLTRDSMSSNITLASGLYDIVIDSLFAEQYILSIVDSFNCVLSDTFLLTEPLPYEAFGSTRRIDLRIR